jgi:hypothetical protein
MRRLPTSFTSSNSLLVYGVIDLRHSFIHLDHLNHLPNLHQLHRITYSSTIW